MTRNNCLATFGLFLFAAARSCNRLPQPRTRPVRCPTMRPVLPWNSSRPWRMARVDVKFIAKSDHAARMIITNKTKQPLNLQMPEAFAGVPVLAQFGGGGGGGAAAVAAAWRRWWRWRTAKRRRRRWRLGGGGRRWWRRRLLQHPARRRPPRSTSPSFASTMACAIRPPPRRTRSCRPIEHLRSARRDRAAEGVRPRRAGSRRGPGGRLASQQRHELGPAGRQAAGHAPQLQPPALFQPRADSSRHGLRERSSAARRSERRSSTGAKKKRTSEEAAEASSEARSTTDADAIEPTTDE